MDYNHSRILDEPSAGSSSLENDPLRNFNLDSLFSPFDYSYIRFDVGNSQLSPEFTTSNFPSNSQSYDPYRTDQDVKTENKLDPKNIRDDATQLEWNPRAVLSNLASLEQKIHRAQDVVRSLIGRQREAPIHHNELAAQQQLATADIASILTQLISTASSILPTAQINTTNTINSSVEIGNLGGSMTKALVQEDVTEMLNYNAEESMSIPIEEHELKESEDGGDCENLPPGSYELLQLEKEEILAPHTHFCLICGKGFKRDANLRMHMRGHGDEYKTPAALAKPVKDSSSGTTPIRRYSCPIIGCKRNKEHKKFQPLKTLLCVKNHYKRTHCDKSYTCSRCNKKKFSVLADLKTHEKHCGHDKWLCSCGTTFSRKDKLFGHVALFQGHTPALPMDNIQVRKTETVDSTLNDGFDFGGSLFDSGFLDVKAFDAGSSFFQTDALDQINFGEFNRFYRSSLSASETSHSTMPVVPVDHPRNGGDNLRTADNSQDDWNNRTL